MGIFCVAGYGPDLCVLWPCLYRHEAWSAYKHKGWVTHSNNRVPCSLHWLKCRLLNELNKGAVFIHYIEYGLSQLTGVSNQALELIRQTYWCPYMHHDSMTNCNVVLAALQHKSTIATATPHSNKSRNTIITVLHMHIRYMYMFIHVIYEVSMTTCCNKVCVGLLSLWSID